MTAHDCGGLGIARWHHIGVTVTVFVIQYHFSRASASAAVSARFRLGRCFRTLQPRPLFPRASASAAVSARFSLGRCFRTLAASFAVGLTFNVLHCHLPLLQPLCRCFIPLHPLSLSLSIIFFFDKENII
jgi:hypothetical protein